MQIYLCSRCGFIFKSLDTHQSIKKQKARYDLHENSSEHKGYRAYFQRFLDFVIPRVDESKTALDFGCGRSTLLGKMLLEHGIDCSCYDPIYYPDIAYDTKKYDLIISVEVFEHLHNPAAEFKKLIGLLNSGGFLAIQTEFAPYSIEEYLQWYYRLDPTHIVFYTAGTFKKLCEDLNCSYMTDNGKNMVIVRR